MAISKKGSRTITVNGIAYRWVVSPDSGYAVVVVELEPNPGERLLGYCNPFTEARSPDAGGLRLNTIHRTISPGAVTRLIRAALERGWQPAKKGTAEFRIRSADAILWPETGTPD